MKILQINKYYYRRGGSESVYFNTIDLLRQHGHEVVAFSTKHPKNIECEYDKYFVPAPEIRDLGVVGKIKSIPRFFRNRKAEKLLRQLIEKEKPDVAHLHNIFNGISLYILPVLKKMGVPVVWTLHDIRMVCPSPMSLHRGEECQKCIQNHYLNCFRKKCYENNTVLSALTMMEMWHKDSIFHYQNYVDRFILMNSMYREMHIRKHPFYQDKSEILYNFFPGKINDTPNRGNYILYYGRMIEEKGVETVLKAAGMLPEVEFVMAGTGPMRDKYQSSLPQNVSMPGYVAGDDLDKLIDGAMFVLVPSECEENNPMTIIEGFSHSKPVIGSDKSGISELVTNKQTGFIYPAANVEALVETISKAVSLSDAEYEAMSRAAAKFAHENFDAEVHYGRLMDIYKRAIDSNKALR